MDPLMDDELRRSRRQKQYQHYQEYLESMDATGQTEDTGIASSGKTMTGKRVTKISKVNSIESKLFRRSIHENTERRDL